MPPAIRFAFVLQVFSNAIEELIKRSTKFFLSWMVTSTTFCVFLFLSVAQTGSVGAAYALPYAVIIGLGSLLVIAEVLGLIAKTFWASLLGFATGLILFLVGLEVSRSFSMDRQNDLINRQRSEMQALLPFVHSGDAVNMEKF